MHNAATAGLYNVRHSGHHVLGSDGVSESFDHVQCVSRQSLCLTRHGRSSPWTAYSLLPRSSPHLHKHVTPLNYLDDIADIFYDGSNVQAPQGLSFEWWDRGTAWALLLKKMEAFRHTNCITAWMSDVWRHYQEYTSISYITSMYIRGLINPNSPNGGDIINL